jgi:low molecular weight protein-tyrosine phosphatase
MIRILFVCLGNICRSPMAEAVFRERVREAGLSDLIEVDSAGTGDWHAGKPAHAGTRGILAEKGIGCDHRARVISRADLDSFDHVVAMDGQNRRDIDALGRGRAAISLFLDHAADLGIEDVPDPYYTGNFEEVYRLVDAAAIGLLAKIRREPAG